MPAPPAASGQRHAVQPLPAADGRRPDRPVAAGAESDIGAQSATQASRTARGPLAAAADTAAARPAVAATPFADPAQWAGPRDDGGTATQTAWERPPARGETGRWDPPAPRPPGPPRVPERPGLVIGRIDVTVVADAPAAPRPAPARPDGGYLSRHYLKRL